MVENRVLAGRTTYECVDKDPESIPGLDGDAVANLETVGYFQLVEAVCDGLACPDYNSEKELTCVVCTR